MIHFFLFKSLKATNLGNGLGRCKMFHSQLFSFFIDSYGFSLPWYKQKLLYGLAITFAKAVCAVHLTSDVKQKRLKN